MPVFTFSGKDASGQKVSGERVAANKQSLAQALRRDRITPGAIREADGQTDPGINADYDYGVFLRNGYGYLDLDRRHQFRVDAAYTKPFWNVCTHELIREVGKDVELFTTEFGVHLENTAFETSGVEGLGLVWQGHSSRG